MLYTINNNTAYEYSKFIHRPKWWLHLEMPIKHKQLNPNFVMPLKGTQELSKDYMFGTNLKPFWNNTQNFFQTCELLCKRHDLQFLNLRAYFSNVLKALHLCWCAARNNKKIVFINHQGSISSNFKLNLVKRCLIAQHQRQTVPQTLEQFVNIQSVTPTSERCKPNLSKTAQAKHSAADNKEITTRNLYSNSRGTFHRLFNLFDLSAPDHKSTDSHNSSTAVSSHLNQNVQRPCTVGHNLATFAKKQSKGATDEASHKLNVQTHKNLQINDLELVTSKQQHTLTNSTLYTKYLIKLQASCALLLGRQTGYCYNANNPAFLGNTDSLLKHVDYLQHLDNSRTVKHIDYYASLKEQAINQVLMNPSSNEENIPGDTEDDLLRLKTKPLAFYEPCSDGNNIPEARLPRMSDNSSDIRSRGFRMRNRLRFSDILEKLMDPPSQRLGDVQSYKDGYKVMPVTTQATNANRNINRKQSNQGHMKKRVAQNVSIHLALHKCKGRQPAVKFQKRFYKANAENSYARFKVKPYVYKANRSMHYPNRLIKQMLKFNYFGKRYETLIKKSDNARNVNFAKNPWLQLADVIFFIDPEKHFNLAYQARRLNIPTIGIVSGVAPSKMGRSGFKRFNLDDVVDYPIIGNAASIFFVRELLEIFIKTVQHASD